MLPHVEMLYDQIKDNLDGYRRFLVEFEANHPEAYHDSEAIAKAVHDLDGCLKVLRELNPDYADAAARAADVQLALGIRFAQGKKLE